MSLALLSVLLSLQHVEPCIKLKVTLCDTAAWDFPSTTILDYSYYVPMVHTTHVYVTHATACDVTVHVLDDASRGLLSKLA